MLPARAAAAFIGDDVNDASDGVGAVQRGPGAAQDFDAIDVGHEHVFDQAGGVGLRGCGVAEAHPVDQHCGILIAQAADADGGESTGSAELLNAQAGGGAQGFRKKEFVAAFDVVVVDHGEGFGDFIGGLRSAGRGDDHLLLGRGELQRKIERQVGVVRDLNLLRDKVTEAVGFGLKDVIAGCEGVETISATGIGGGVAAGVPVASEQRDGRAGNCLVLGVFHDS